MNGEKRKILVIDDERAIGQQLEWSLKRDYEVSAAWNGEDGMRLARDLRPDVVILDLALSHDGDANEGLQVLEEIQLSNPETKVIIVTGNEQRELAIKAVQMGAYDFYRKPIDLAEFRVIVDRALHLKKLESEIILPAGGERLITHEIVGKCSQMLAVFDIIKRTSKTDATILIHSESGTGKELVAKAIHFQSPRRENPFVVINCGAIPENLLESELFGHEKGAFTGAHVQRVGKFELAKHGTVFLDEIGELSLALQVKLLRVLQEREIERVGGRGSIPLDVRIIAATNKDLEHEVEMGNFRTDLFYRLSVITLGLPPLRDRGGDIMILARHFLERCREEYNSNVRGFSSEAIKLIQAYHWPGNVRELENKVRRAVIMARKPLIIPEDLNLKASRSDSRLLLREQVAEFESACIREALSRNAGNVSRTAQQLGVNRTTFYDMLHRYEIDHLQYRLS